MKSFPIHSSIVPWLGLTIAFAITVGSAQRLFSQDSQGIEVSVDTEEVFVGESLTLQVSVLNIESPSAPSMEGVEKSFEVKLVGERPINQSSTTIINGRISQRNFSKNIYEYQITPRSSGEATIPALTIRSKGKTFSSDPITIKVTVPSPQDIVLIETSISHNHVYPTQYFDVTLKLLVRELPGVKGDPLRALVRRPPNLSLPWLDTPDGLSSPDGSRWLNKLLSDQNYGFAINNLSTPGAFLFDGPQLALFDLAAGTEKRKTEDGKERTYYRYQITKSFRAERPGIVSFGPAMVKGTFVVEERGGNFLGKKLAAIAPKIDISVKEVPSPRPPMFIGGIGKYGLEASVAPAECRVGDPVTLSLAVSSEDSNLDLVSSPNLSLVSEIADGFEVVDPNPIGLTEGETKRFTYVLRPKSIDAKIPAMQFDVFDPSSEAFVPLTSNQVELKIHEAQSVGFNSNSINKTAAAYSNNKDTSGIHLESSEDYPIRNESPRVGLLVGVVGLSWLASLATALWVVTARARKERGARNRAKNWPAIVELGLQHAQRLVAVGKDVDAVRELRKLVSELIAVPAGVDPQGLTTEEILSIASSSPWSAPSSTESQQKQIRDLRGLLESIDASLYSGIVSDCNLLLRDSRSLLIAIAHEQSKYSRKTDKSSRRLVPSIGLVIVAVMSLESTSLGYTTPEVETSNAQQVSLEHPIPDADVAKLVDSLKEKNSQEGYRQIAEQLSQIIASGSRGGAAYFHLGNAWYLAGNYGRSVYAYRIAERYTPSDLRIKANLAQAMKALRGEQEEAEHKSEEPLQLAATLLPAYSAQTILVAGVGIFAAFGFAWGVLHRHRTVLVTSIAGLVLLLLLAWGVWSGSPDRYQSRFGTILRDVVAREGMSESSPSAFADPLRAGIEVEVIRSTPSWALIRQAGSRDAWIPTTQIAFGS